MKLAAFAAFLVAGTDNAELQAWRTRTVKLILQVGVALGTVALLGVGVQCAQTGQWATLAPFGGIYGMLLAVGLLPQVPTPVRAWFIVILAWLTSFVAYSRGGLIGAGVLWTVTLPVIATILVGIYAGLLMAAACLGTYAVFAVLAEQGRLAGSLIYATNPTSLSIWAFEGVYTIVVLGIMLALLIAFHRLQLKILAEQAQMNQVLEARVYARTAELEVMKAAADRANKAKSEFLASMSHELRTPLNAVMGYAQILERDPGLTATQRDGIRVILKSGEHLLRLINDILDLAKIEAGKLDLFPGDVALGEFLTEIGDIIRARAEQKQVLFVLERGTLPLGIRADETRLRQVLLNLLSNAVKFTTQGRVTLRVTQLQYTPAVNGGFPTSNLRFEVEDTGIGMDAKQVSRLFQPFTQVGNTVEYINQGTGLGLALSQQLAQAMGSTIRVQSAVLEGTRFWFELPAVPVVPVMPAEPTLPTVAGYAGPRRKILVVDDRGYNRLVLVDMLTQLGFDVLEAEDGQAAIGLAVAEHPDLILMDLVMPALTGIEATQQLRQYPLLAHTPIVAVSASAFAEDRREAQIAGCDGFLPKPIKLLDLLRLLERLLGLTWRYSGDNALTTLPAAAPELVYPAPERLREIRAWAESGDLLAIEPLLAQLETEYGVFCRELRHLLQEFDDAGIVALTRAPATR